MPLTLLAVAESVTVVFAVTAVVLTVTVADFCPAKIMMEVGGGTTLGLLEVKGTVILPGAAALKRHRACDRVPAFDRGWIEHPRCGCCRNL